MGTKVKKENVRKVNFLMGLIVIIISILVLIFSFQAVVTLLFILAISLFIIGLARVINGSSNEKFPNSVRAWKVISGVSAIIISILGIIFLIINPELSVNITIFVFGIALLLIGIGRVLAGLTQNKFDNWYRYLLTIVGIFTIILSIIVIIYPSIGLMIIVIMLALPMLLNGLLKMILGIIDKD